MGRIKILMSNKNDKESKKISHLQSDEKPVRSKIKKKSNLNNKTEDNEFDVDSLECMRDSTKKKKLSVIDERIKLLKTELKTLHSGKTVGDISDGSIDTVCKSKNSGLKNVHNINKIKPIVLESNNIKLKKRDEDFNNSQNGKSLVEQPRTEIFVDTIGHKLPDVKNSNLNSNSSYVDEVIEANTKLINVLSLSQEKVEQLLYESFVIKNSKLNLPYIEESDSKQRKSAVKTKNQKFRKSTNQCKVANKKLTQLNLNKYCRPTQRGRKRRKVNLNYSLSDIEVVHLDSSSCSNAEPRNDITCIDLNIKDYDWNEPFDLDNTEISSELKTFESYEKKEVDENEKLILNNIDMKETEISYNNENEKTILKQTWECPVCFEHSKGQEVVATQCGHIFCKKCLESHFSKLGKNCPSCRTILRNKPFITLFNF